MDPALTSLPEQPPVAILPLDALQQTLHDLGVYIDAQSFVERVLAQHSEDLARAVKDQGELEKDIVPTLTSKCDVAKPANDPATVMETAQEIKPTASTSASTVEHQKVPVAVPAKHSPFPPYNPIYTPSSPITDPATAAIVAVDREERRKIFEFWKATFPDGKVRDPYVSVQAKVDSGGRLPSEEGASSEQVACV